MTIVLDQPWQVALFITLCVLAMFCIARDWWRSVTTPKRPRQSDKG